MISNLINNKGNAAANQFVINKNGIVYFQSYESPICRIENNKVTLTSDWDYSNTTRKHLYIFLEQNYKGYLLNLSRESKRKSILAAIEKKSIKLGTFYIP